MERIKQQRNLLEMDSMEYSKGREAYGDMNQYKWDEDRVLR